MVLARRRVSATLRYRLQNAEAPFMLDLLEWQEPSDASPPHEHLHHLGIARVALDCDDLDADSAFLKSQGEEFLSEPATVKMEGRPATRFVCCKDPHGTIPELVQ